MKVIASLGLASVAAAQNVIGSASGNVRVRTTTQPASAYAQNQFVRGEATLAMTGTQSLPGQLGGTFGELRLEPGSPDYLGQAAFWGGVVDSAPVTTWSSSNVGMPAPAWTMEPVGMAAPAWTMEAPAWTMEAPAWTMETPAWTMEAPAWTAPEWNWEPPAPVLDIYGPAPVWDIYGGAAFGESHSWSNDWNPSWNQVVETPAWNEWNWEAPAPVWQPPAPVWDIYAGGAVFSQPSQANWWDVVETPAWSAAPTWDASWANSQVYQMPAGIYQTPLPAWNAGLIYSPSSYDAFGIYTPSSWNSPSDGPGNSEGPQTTLVAATTSGAFKPRIQGTRRPNPVPGSPSGGGGACVGIGCGTFYGTYGF